MKVFEFIKEILMWYVWFGKKILPLVKYGGVVLLGLVVVLSFAQNLPIPGNFKSLVVMSGSMEPKIHVGSVAIVKPSEEIKTDDIITFKDPRDPTNLVTHRIVEEKEGIFKTKGDANDAPDPWEVRPEDVVGKYKFSIPYLGYAVNFAKRPQGFLLLILFPAILIIASEVLAIKRELMGVKATKGKGGKETLLATTVCGILLTFAFSSGKTLALLSDTETSSGNTISAGVWDVAEYSVVLNEFVPNPVGDDDALRPGGEWVELYNKSASEFDLAGWYLYDAYDDHELPITAANSESHSHDGSLLNSNTTVIPADGFLLVYRNGDGDFELNNSGGDTVRLYNGAIGGAGVIMVNSHIYTSDAGENKSFARIPDGSDNWVDPIPTPGGPNELGPLIEEEQRSEPGPAEEEPTSEPEEDVVSEPKTEPETESTVEPQPTPEPEPEPDADDVVALPEATESAQPAPATFEPAPESTESAKPKESSE